MTHKYERKCWNCGSENMEPDDRGVHCNDCGATWNNVPNPGASPVTAIDAISGKSPRPGRPVDYRPSGYLTRSATIKRNKKADA